MPKTRIAAETPPAEPGTLPLYAVLRERLKAQILEGRLRPGERLPSESELTQAHGVSRITVRQALNDLQKEGLLVKAHGKGSFVAQPAVALDLTRLRGLAESLSGAGRTIHTQILALGHVPASDEVARAFELAPGEAVTELQTLRYLNREPLVLSRSWMPRVYGDRLSKADLAHRDVLDIYEHDLGVAIGKADVTLGAVNADAQRHARLGVAPGAALVVMERRVYSRAGQVVHIEKSAYRADRFSYSLTLERGAAAPGRAAGASP